MYSLIYKVCIYDLFIDFDVHVNVMFVFKCIHLDISFDCIKNKTRNLGEHRILLILLRLFKTFGQIVGFANCSAHSPYMLF